MNPSLLRNNIFVLIIIFCLALSAYSFVLSAEFKTMDDEVSIVQNRPIKDLSNAGKLFTLSFFEQNSYYRPLVSLSFMLEYQAFGLNAVFYYLNNILIHVAVAFLVFLIAEILLVRRTRALLVALLFVIHPIHWEAVSNIPGRAILLCAFFYLLTFYSYLNFRRSQKKAWYVFSLVAFILALLSKESAGMLPVILAAYELLLPGGERAPRRRSWRALIPFILLNIVYVLFRKSSGLTHFYYWEHAGQAVMGFLTFLRAVMTYLRLFLFPVDLHFDRAAPLIPSLQHRDALLVIVFFAAAVLMLFRRRRSIPAVAWFGLAWFFIALVPVSQVLFTIGVQPGYISAAEHFVYLPSVGLFLAAVACGAQIAGYLQEKKFLPQRALKLLLGGFCVFLFMLTIAQNLYSRSEVAMFERAVKLNPRNVRVQYNLAFSYVKLGEFQSAEQAFRRVLELVPGNAKAAIGLGKTLCEQKKYWEGLMVYEAVDNAEGLEPLRLDNIRATLEVLKQTFEPRLRDEPGNAQLWYTLGVIASKQQDVPGAVAYYLQAVTLDPEFPEALFNLASSYQALGDPVSARHYYGLLLPRLADDHELKPHVQQALSQILQEMSDSP